MISASSLKDWFIPKTPCNVKRPEPTPTQEVEFSAAFMLQEVSQAGAPAGGSDGSWTQSQSADATGINSSGITPADMLCASDPWRAQVQQLQVPAGQPASFAPMSRATTPFGTPQSAGSTNSLQARLHSIP
eukprot:6717532-Pyramimonas_sp.AAC.1